jgi:P4 family phage/plasmid primase-like protien
MSYNKVQKKIIKTIEKLLNESKTIRGQTDYTHVSLGGVTFPGKFTFSNKDQRKKLNKLLSKALNNNLHFSIAERCKDYGPVKVDIDMNYPIDDWDKPKLYENDIILEVIKIYRNIIQKYCNPTDEELECFIFEKEKMSEKNGEYKDGFHLMFPNCNLYYKTRHLIVNDVINYCNDKSLFDKYTNADVVDKAVVSTNPWLIYGCCKPNKEAYKLIKIIDNNDNEKDHSMINNYDLIKLLSLRSSKWTDSNSTQIKEEYDDNIISETYSDLGVKKNNENLNNNIMTEEQMELIEKALKLTNMFSNKRSNNYHSWLRVGWALHNTDTSLLDTWISFSKRSRKFKEGECEQLWTNMKDGGYTIRSLMLWAKEDSPDDYKNFTQEYFNNILKSNNNINNTYCIAKALHCKYSDRFICADPKNHIWYYYANHRWNETNNGGKLITLMSQDFSSYYAKKAGQYNVKASISDEMTRKTLLEEAKIFNTISLKLMDINFKEKIMKEAQYIFFEEDFINRLNQKKYLICFKNGIYDLTTRKFRDGHPDDHISLCTNVHYKEYNPENVYIKKIEKFFKTVLTNKNVREYFLSRLSTCVSGENKEEKVYFCTGSGSNGKSLTFSLVAKALGDYYLSCPITIITKKRSEAGKASPELERLDGPRCGVFQEPEGDEQVNVGIFKELSGNDRFMVRGLYKKPREIEPQLKYWLTCNDLPKIPSDDGGTWRRIRVIDFASKFIENPDQNNQNQFPIDYSLKENIGLWAPAFASYLIHIYITKYDVKNKVAEPTEVMCATNKYRKDQDLIREYYDTYLIITDDKRDKLTKRELSSHFKFWAKNERDVQTPPKPDKLYELISNEMEKKYGNGNYGTGWKKICIRNVNDEQSEDSDSD